MAKVFPDLAGGYSGKVGKSLYYRVKKDCFVKTLPEKTTPPTERQSEQQLLFEMMGQLSGAMAEVSQHGFPKCAKKLWTAPNMFIHVNKGLCTVESTETGAVSVDGDGRELQPLQAGRRAVRGRAGERPFPVQNRPHRHARRGRHVVDHAAHPVEQGRAPRVRVRHERERKRRLPFRLSPNSTSIHYLFAAASLRDGVPAR